MDRETTAVSSKTSFISVRFPWPLTLKLMEIIFLFVKWGDFGWKAKSRKARKPLSSIRVIYAWYLYPKINRDQTHSVSCPWMNYSDSRWKEKSLLARKPFFYIRVQFSWYFDPKSISIIIIPWLVISGEKKNIVESRLPTCMQMSHFNDLRPPNGLG